MYFFSKKNLNAPRPVFIIQDSKLVVDCSSVQKKTKRKAHSHVKA